MVDEVEIKITADASEAQKALRNTDFYIKALKEDTELLKDLQVEYKKALAETGGKLTGDALKIHKQILDVKSSIAKSEREIEKSSKGQFKSFKGMSKLFGGKGRMMAGFGVAAASLYAFKSIKDAVVSNANEIRSQYLSSISTGMAGSDYSRIVGGAAALGVSEGNLNAVLSNINSGLISLEKGIGQNFEKLIYLQNRTGIPLTTPEGKYKTQKQLLKEIQDWVKTQEKDYALEVLSPLGFTPDLIDEMKDGNLFAEKNIGLTEDEIKANKELAKATAELNEETKNLGRVLSSKIAPALTALAKSSSANIAEVTKFFRGEQAGEIYDIVSSSSNRTSLNSILDMFLSGALEKERAKTAMSKFYGRDLTQQEIQMFENKKAVREYIGQLEAEQYYHSRAIRLQKYYQQEADRSWTEMGKNFDLRKKAEFERAEKVRAERLRTGSFYKPVLKNIDVIENGKKYHYDENGDKWDILDLSKVPEKASSLTGEKAGRTIEQKADVQLNFYGDADPEQVQGAVETGLQNGFQEAQQQVV